MRIYLDSCCLQRPFDDQTQPRIKVEAEAVLAILACVEAGDISLLNSDALEYELGRIPEQKRRKEAMAMLALAAERLQITQASEALAESLEGHGIPAIDSVHLALASAARADYFGTCDDRLARKAQAISTLECQVLPVLNLVLEILK